MNPTLKARLEKEAQEKENLFEKIDYNDDLPFSLRKIVFEKAWELGHDAGENEVKYYFDFLMDMQMQILNTCY